MKLLQSTWQHLQHILPFAPHKKSAAVAASAQEPLSASPKAFGTAHFPPINISEIDELILDQELDPLKALDRLLSSSPRYQVTWVQPAACSPSATAPQTSLAQVLMPKEAGRKRSLSR